MSHHRFLQTKDSVTSFAAVEVTAASSSEWQVEWAAVDGHVRLRFADSVAEGIAIARAADGRTGASARRVTIDAITISAVDTTDDAVRCATAIALWMALGHLESETALEHRDGSWGVSLGKGKLLTAAGARKGFRHSAKPLRFRGAVGDRTPDLR